MAGNTSGELDDLVTVVFDDVERVEVGGREDILDVLLAFGADDNRVDSVHQDLLDVGQVVGGITIFSGKLPGEALVENYVFVVEEDLVGGVIGEDAAGVGVGFGPELGDDLSEAGLMFVGRNGLGKVRELEAEEGYACQEGKGLNGSHPFWRFQAVADQKKQEEDGGEEEGRSGRIEESVEDFTAGRFVGKQPIGESSGKLKA